LMCMAPHSFAGRDGIGRDEGVHIPNSNSFAKGCKNFE